MEHLIRLSAAVLLTSISFFLSKKNHFYGPLQVQRNEMSLLCFVSISFSSAATNCFVFAVYREKMQLVCFESACLIKYKQNDGKKYERIEFRLYIVSVCIGYERLFNSTTFYFSREPIVN